MSETHEHPNYVKIWYWLLVLLAISVVGPMFEIPALTLLFTLLESDAVFIVFFCFPWIEPTVSTLNKAGGVISKVTSLSSVVSSIVSPTFPAKSIKSIEMGMTPSESDSVNT